MRSKEEQRGAKRSNKETEEQGGAWSGGARRNSEELRGTGRNNEEQGGAGRN